MDRPSGGLGASSWRDGIPQVKFLNLLEKGGKKKHFFPRWEVFPLGIRDWNSASKTTKTTTFADCGSECRHKLINYKSCHGIRFICSCISMCICICIFIHMHLYLNCGSMYLQLYLCFCI